MTLISLVMRASWGLLVSALLSSVLHGLVVSAIVSTMNDALAASASDMRRLGVRFALLCLGMLGLRWLALSQFVRLSQQVLARLRLHVSRSIAEIPYCEAEARGAGPLLAVLTEDIATVSEGFMLLPWLCVHGVVLVACLGYLAFLSPTVFGFIAAMIVLGSLGYARGVHEAHTHLESARAEEDTLFAHFRSLFAGAKELRMHAGRQADFLSELLAPSADRVRAERTRGLFIHAGLANWRTFLVFAAIGGVVWVLCSVWQLPVQVRSGYALVLLYVILPVNALLEAVPALNRTRVALDRVRALEAALDQSAETSTTLQPLAATTVHSIELKDVTLRYRSDDGEQTFLLGPISFELAEPEVVFIVGGNGSGKTTLAKLFVGLLEPDSGELLLNGEPVTGALRATYRECHSAIFADFHLFDSVVDAQPAAAERARFWLQELALAHKVTLEHGQFSTTALSAGQRKRLMLVLAQLENRPIYVFDEWAAEQEPVHKQTFYERVLPELKARGKRVVVITHDDRYFHLADRCLKLESGRLLPSDLAAVAKSVVRRAAPSHAAGEP